MGLLGKEQKADNNKKRSAEGSELIQMIGPGVSEGLHTWGRLFKTSYQIFELHFGLYATLYFEVFQSIVTYTIPLVRTYLYGVPWSPSHDHVRGLLLGRCELYICFKLELVCSRNQVLGPFVLNPKHNSVSRMFLQVTQPDVYKKTTHANIASTMTFSCLEMFCL